MSMTGRGILNEWTVCYGNVANYQGYIHDSNDVRIHVSESDALLLAGILNGLIEALGDIADRFDTYETTEAHSLCEYAYDELHALGHIIRVDKSEETG